jgi:hypothetical protein
MKPMIDLDEINRLVSALDFGTASAVKRGRNPAFPYVPIIDHGDRTENPARGNAFKTRAEAVAEAQRCIDARREHLRRTLAEPRMRALREQHGLPRDIT